ncbi:MAG: hypothetical protein NVS9B14_13910 [Candidatus Acidiferrum sp.]
MELRFVPAPQPHLAVHVSYDLKNSGNQPLQSIRVILPSADAFRRTATSALWNMQPLQPQIVSVDSPADRGDSIELRLPEAWPVKQQRSLVFDYELSTGSHLGSFLAASPQSFFAYPDSWNPELLPPRHLFGTGGVPPKKWTIAVRVPARYLVHASGIAGKRSGSSGEWIYSFTEQLRGFAPFAAGGKYLERETRIDRQRILFWTFQPVDSTVAQQAASSIAARARYCETEYGSPTSEDRTIRLLECVPPATEFGCGALPQTVFVHQNWVARGLKDSDFLQDANFELAYTWFGGISRVRFDESPLPMAALAPFAGWEAQASAAGNSARSERIRTLIANFDRQTADCKGKVLLPVSAGASGCAYSATWTESGLLYFALEDKVGRAVFHSALKQALESRRGRDLSLQDLIAAIDAESQQKQGPFIRAWLKHPAIPDDLRARYAGVAASVAESPSPSQKEHLP